MASSKENAPTPKWNLKKFIVALQMKEAEAPASLSTEELALLEIIALGSPVTHAAQKKYLVAFFKNRFVMREPLAELASARTTRPTEAQIQETIAAGWFEWSPDEREVARHAVHHHRGGGGTTGQTESPSA